jgi:hypothetical protein
MPLGELTLVGVDDLGRALGSIGPKTFTAWVWEQSQEGFYGIFWLRRNFAKIYNLIQKQIREGAIIGPVGWKTKRPCRCTDACSLIQNTNPGYSLVVNSHQAMVRE